jgi:signal transduction histidine kinase
VLARRLTEAMNGTLELTSVIGVGTHITVTLASVPSATSRAVRA